VEISLVCVMLKLRDRVSGCDAARIKKLNGLVSRNPSTLGVQAGSKTEPAAEGHGDLRFEAKKERALSVAVSTESNTSENAPQS